MPETRPVVPDMEMPAGRPVAENDIGCKGSPPCVFTVKEDSSPSTLMRSEIDDHVSESRIGGSVAPVISIAFTMGFSVP